MPNNIFFLNLLHFNDDRHRVDSFGVDLLDGSPNEEALDAIVREEC